MPKVRAAPVCVGLVEQKGQEAKGTESRQKKADQRKQRQIGETAMSIYKRFACSKGGTCNKKGPNRECDKCLERSDHRKDGTYWYKFTWYGKLVRESTKQGNDKIARQMESAHRTSLAKGEVGLRDKKPSPTLKEFIDNRFEPWAKATFEKASPKTWLAWYRVGLRAIKNYKPLADSKLDEITSETLADFAAHRQAQGLQVST